MYLRGVYLSLFILEDSDIKLEKIYFNTKFVSRFILLLFIFWLSELKAQTVQDSVKMDSVDICEMLLEKEWL